VLKRDVSVVITDLDNTLYDWVEVWYRSFSTMLDTVLTVAQQRGVSRDQLVQEIRAVHQRHGTSEYAFLLEELPSLQAAFPGEDLVSRFDDAIHGYRKARKEHLKLYPGVMATLRTLKDSGVLIVAYTESMAFYTNYRMRHLELDGVIDCLYSLKDHDLPFELAPEQLRKYPSEHYRLKFTEHRHTPEGELKPNPRVLLDTVQDIGADPHSCIYVGDSLMKDVAMAKDAGVVDVYALYGEAQDRLEYTLLREVSHWTDADVERERELEHRHVNPTHTLERSFSELFTMFRFVSFNNHADDTEGLKNKIEIWKKVVDVQQHFNDLEMRIRNVAVTILGALFGAAGLALSRDVTLEIGGLLVPLGVILLLAALLTWAAFYFMDRHWYHRLLYGAVKHERKIEDAIKGRIPEITLTESIGEESPIRFRGSKIHSTAKIDLFYGVGAGAIVLTVAILLFTAETGPESSGGQATGPGGGNGQMAAEGQRAPATQKAAP
jgi:phosphoglycolate phosphatase-like HAD superfamily hydrolase